MANRYARQTALPEVGAKGQDKLSQASVLCIGAGGLGCPALLYLAAAGVGTLGIIDFDTVDESNLQRQVLFTTKTLGQNKAQAAKAHLQVLNPDISITAYPEELNAQNAERLFTQYDIIIDGTDSFDAKFLINDAAVKVGKPMIYGSILGFDGQVCVFNYQNGPCYRCLFPSAPKRHIQNCAEAGVIGAVAGIIGTTQAMEAIKLILGHPDLPSLAGKLWTIDLRSMNNQRLSLAKSAHCPTCSKPTGEIPLNYKSKISALVPEITITDAQKNCTALYIDVRENDEWAVGRIKNAHHFSLSKLVQGTLPDLPKSCEIIVYCQKGTRSLQAADILINQGYANIHSLSGGYEEWMQKREEQSYK